MAASVLILGESFIHYLCQFVLGDSRHFSVDFNLSHHVVIKWQGIGGCMVPKTLKHDLPVVEAFQPDIVILQLGSNDLMSADPLKLAQQ